MNDFRAWSDTTDKLALREAKYDGIPTDDMPEVDNLGARRGHYAHGIPERDVQLGTADCMICRAHQPSSHVSVRNTDGEIIGRVCASHTFYEAIFQARIYGELVWDPA